MMQQDQTPVRHRPVKRVLRRVLAVLALAVLLALASSWYVAGALIAPHRQATGTPPSDLLAETVQIHCDPDVVLSGWYAHQHQAKGAVLLLHGIRASRLKMVNRARLLTGEGYSVLLIDFRAHGESSGKYISVGYDEQHDVTAALDFLRQRQPSLPLAIIGISMGGAASVLAKPHEIDALVLESVYPSIADAVQNRVRKRIGFLEPIATWILLAQLRLRLGISPEDLRPIDVLPDLDCPVLMMTGAEDTDTTLSETQQMFEHAREPKELEIFPGVGHRDLFHHDPGRYRKRVLPFLERHLAGDPDSGGAD